MTGEPESLFIFIAMSGRIKLHRKVIDNPISNNIELLWLFSYLLLKANHKEKSFYLWLKKVKVEPWQFISSQVEIASHFKLSRSKVIRHLNTLVDEKIVNIKWYTKYSLFTIVNRQQYQDSEHQTIQQSIQQTDTNNNDKEIKENNLLSIIETWNKIKWFKSTRKITDEIKTQRNKVMKKYTIDEFELAVNNYYEDILSRKKTDDPKWYDKHRFTFYEFIKQDNWLQKRVNK